MAEEKKEKSDYFSTFLYLKLLLLPISIAIITIMMFTQAEQVQIEDPIQIKIIFLFLFNSFVENINKIYKYSFQAQLKIVKSQLPTLINKLAKGIFQIISIFLFNNFPLFIFATLLGTVINTVISMVMGKKYKIKKPKKDLLVSYIKFAFPLMIPGLITLFINNYATFIFLKYHSEELLGVYSIINTGIALLALIQTAFNSIFLPSYSNMIKKNKIDKLREQITLYERYMVMVWAIIMITGLIIGPNVIEIIYTEYYSIEGADYLFLSLLMIIFWAILDPYSIFLIANDRLKVNLIISLGSLIISVTSWFIFIPTLDIVGMKIGTLIGSIITVPIVRYITYKDIKIGKMNKKNFYTIMTSSVYIIITYFLKNHLSPNLICRTLELLIILLVLFVNLWVFRLITKEDLKILKDLANVKKFFNYIKDGFD